MNNKNNDEKMRRTNSENFVTQKNKNLPESLNMVKMEEL